MLSSKMNRAAGAVGKMMASGQTAAYISKALGVATNLIYRWKNRNRDGNPARTPKTPFSATDID